MSSDAETPTPLLRCLADVQQRAVSWLWPRRIPEAMPSVLFGPTGLGKSHMWTDIVARVSIGALWPDEGRATVANCVIMSAEDDAETVIVPRLKYAGADLHRVFVFPSVAAFDERGRRAFSVHEDAARLEEEIKRVSARLAIIDPITAYLRGVDSKTTTEVREVLAVVDDVARRTGAAILCVSHPNKSNGAATPAIHRLTGSSAFGDAPRSVMAVVSDPEDEDRRLLLPVKLNIARRPEGLGFRIVADSPDTCDSGVQWDSDPVSVDADEAFGSPHVDSPAIERAKDFLLGQLADGEWHAAKELIEAAVARGISERTLQRARGRMSVEWRKDAFGGGNLWRLAEDTAEPSSPIPTANTPLAPLAVIGRH
ncbi:MAG: AAA family ATPase [Thermoleophilia bacterium]